MIIEIRIQALVLTISDVPVREAFEMGGRKSAVDAWEVNGWRVVAVRTRSGWRSYLVDSGTDEAVWRELVRLTSLAWMTTHG